MVKQHTKFIQTRKRASKMSLLRDLCNLAVSSKLKEFSGRKSQRLSLSNDRIVRMQYLLMCLPEILWELKFRRFTRSSVVGQAPFKAVSSCNAVVQNAIWLGNFHIYLDLNERQSRYED